MASSVEALYKNAPLVLWVEDEDSQTYLGELWSTERVGLHIAGNGGAVAAVVRDARSLGHRHVFGLVDRDFGGTNRNRWIRPSDDLIVYKLASLEIENLLLDPTALAACDLNRLGKKPRTTDELARRMRSEAVNILWWMAWRRVMTDLRHERLHDFPKVPRRDSVQTRNETLALLLADPWLKREMLASGPGLTDDILKGRLDKAKEDFDSLLNGDGWIEVFSGKEIFRQIAGYVWNGKGSAGRLDLVRSVAKAQMRLGRVPAEVTELLASLTQRTGLAGP